MKRSGLNHEQIGDLLSNRATVDFFRATVGYLGEASLRQGTLSWVRSLQCSSSSLRMSRSAERIC